MEQAILDVNKQAESSSADVKGDASSASGDGKQETPLSIAMKAADASASSGTTDKDKSEAEKSQAAEPQPESGSKIEPHEKEEEKPDGEKEEPTEGEDEDVEVKEDVEEVEDGEAKTDEDGKLEKTFAQSKRFQELNQKVKDLEPLAQQASTINSFCEQKGITGEQLRDALYVAGLMNDPSKVDELKKIMTPFFESLGFASGEKLPEDLQKDVNEGALSVERAKELARFRAQTQMQTQMQQNAQQRQSKQQVAVALAQWEASKEKSDPDWKKRVPMTNAFYQAKVNAHQGVLTANDHVRYAEEAYIEAKNSVTPFLPKPKTNKILRTNGSSKTTKVVPKTPLEAAMAVAEGRKVDYGQ